MIRGNGWAWMVAALLVGACGDDDGPTRSDEPDLTRADVAGQYEMTELSFDPQGSLPGVDLLARLDADDPPRLFVASNEDSLALTFVDPEGGLPRDVPGGYELGDEDVSIDFENAVEPAQILLPPDLVLAFDSAAGTLSFGGAVHADTTRLFVLVPEWSGEPVTNPLPGTLSVTFSRD